MGQNFIPDTVDQTLLFPPSLHDWLPEGHMARFLLDVVSALDLSAIYKSYQEKDGRGQQPAEALPGRRGSGNGIKRQENGPVLPKTAQKAHYKPPTGLLPARPSSNTSPANR